MIRALCFIACLAVSVAHADPLTVSTKYAAAGTNPDGSAYTGTVTIKLISDTTFKIHWDIAGDAYDGFGMRMNDSLAATYMIGGDPGLVIYHVNANGSFNGLWAIRGQNGNGTERLTPAN